MWIGWPSNRSHPRAFVSDPKLAWPEPRAVLARRHAFAGVGTAGKSAEPAGEAFARPSGRAADCRSRDGCPQTSAPRTAAQAAHLGPRNPQARPPHRPQSIKGTSCVRQRAAKTRAPAKPHRLAARPPTRGLPMLKRSWSRAMPAKWQVPVRRHVCGPPHGRRLLHAGGKSPRHRGGALVGRRRAGSVRRPKDTIRPGRPGRKN